VSTAVADGPNKTLQQTAATGVALPGLQVSEVAAAAELGRSALEDANELVVHY
jgi:hypothetical protein